ncbi:MAG TPA: nickel insertion protein, partial [Candidatus Krumholzibacterium sp.]|nr:nickel insertion protein [Candidatus Krumholzibacterium sp.]
VIYSVGTRERHPGPGMLRLVEALPSGGAGYVSAIRTTIDDMNPEIFGYLQERLFGAGALEVYVTQVLMKKNRPGSLLTVLCETGDVDRMAGLLFAETTTLGMRVSVEGRIELERFHEEVRTPYGKISVKFGRLPGSMVKFSPEYESCRKAALKAGVPVRVVYDAAMKAAGRK